MTSAYLSFGEQALHYFQRPHDDIPTRRIESAAAWRSADLGGSAAWSDRIAPDELAELETAWENATRDGISMADLSRATFPLPLLAERIRSWRRELMEGRGFLVVRGFPVNRWGEEKASYIYWGIGLHLGRPGAQNPQGDLLGHVIDTGEDAANPFVRRYRTSGDIAYHCDLADVVGLLCLSQGRSGGASRLASSVAVFNELLDRRPELAKRLFEPVLLDRRDEGGSGPGYVPVYACRYANGQLRTFYHSDYFRSVTRHPDVAPFTAEEQELFDTYEAIANSPEFAIDMQLEPGDLQLVSNHFVIHARRAYEDGPDTGRRRHLLRLWLSLD